MDLPRSPLASPRGKRRILVQQDSLGPEPPKKSPVHTSAPVSFAGWDCAWPATLTWSTEQRSFSPIPGSPAHQRCSSPQGSSDQDQFSGQAPPTGGRRPKLGLIGRGTSKDIMDNYFAMKRNRRRSSCKEITLQFFQEDTYAPHGGTNTPVFRTIESRRRVSIAPQLSCDDVREVREPHEGPGELDVAVAAANLARSLSADAYDAEAKLEERQETQALLFDSVPDLANIDNYEKFPTLRNYRRGAICYDPDLATDLLTNLSLQESDKDEDL